MQRDLYASAEGYDKRHGFWPMVDRNLEGVREEFQRPEGQAWNTGEMSEAEKDEIE